ncbi:hypothetical protein [uncultured Thiohalocapsa sp.]|uniref:hypothetical protein n=1 Tax=uncultured Thiohalocapsa sp. TaxID=768990 RepID=UPI0025D64168|nr:hypothetical protein [uncultured Thiohalocapsa sp.]
MNHCKDCRALWPFGFALALAVILAFPAWATFNLMALDVTTQIAGTALVFVVSAVGLMLYVRWCIRRNCALRRMLTEQRSQSPARQASGQRGSLVAAPR